MSRLYAFESSWTLTGGAADYRAPVASRKIGALAGHLAYLLFVERGLPLPAGCEGLRAELAPFASDTSEKEMLDAAARGLLEHRGAAIVVAGPKQPAAVHALCHLINAGLGNGGATVRWTADPDPSRASHVESIRDLADAMASGSVEALLVLGGNPVFDAPADLEFEKRLASVKHRAHLSLYVGDLGGVHLAPADGALARELVRREGLGRLHRRR